MTSLKNKRILVAEDHVPLARQIKIILEDMDIRVVGPTSTVADSLEQLDQERVDMAVVDLTLRDGKAAPLCERLDHHQIPLVLMSGYDASDVPGHFARYPRLTKPFTGDDLVAALAKLLESSTSQGSRGGRGGTD